MPLRTEAGGGADGAANEAGGAAGTDGAGGTGDADGAGGGGFFAAAAHGGGEDEGHTGADGGGTDVDGGGLREAIELLPADVADFGARPSTNLKASRTAMSASVLIPESCVVPCPLSGCKSNSNA